MYDSPDRRTCWRWASAATSYAREIIEVLDFGCFALKTLTSGAISSAVGTELRRHGRTRVTVAMCGPVYEPVVIGLRLAASAREAPASGRPACGGRSEATPA